MTARTPAYLKQRFENNDIPQGTDYEDVFDSYLNVATSAAQSINGPLTINGALTASSLNIGNFDIATVSAALVRATTISAATLYADVAKIVTASAANSYTTDNDYIGALNVSAVATTQTSSITVASPLTFVTFADNNDNSVRLPSSVRGRRQAIVNATTTVVKIFPAVSSRFLVTAFNAPLILQADRTMTVFHQGDDRYGVQIG